MHLVRHARQALDLVLSVACARHLLLRRAAQFDVCSTRAQTTSRYKLYYRTRK